MWPLDSTVLLVKIEEICEMAQDPIVHVALIVAAVSLVAAGFGIVATSILRGRNENAATVAAGTFLCLVAFVAFLFWLIIRYPV